MRRHAVIAMLFAAITTLPAFGQPDPVVPSPVDREALTAFRQRLEARAREQMGIPFEATLTVSDVWTTTQAWKLRTETLVTPSLDAQGRAPADDPLLQLVEWSRELNAKLSRLTSDAIRDEGIDPGYDPEMDFELSVRAVVRSPRMLGPLRETERPRTIHGIRPILDQDMEERLVGGRLASLVFRGDDLDWASDGHTSIDPVRDPPAGAQLSVEIVLDSDRLDYGQPLTGRVIVTNVGTRRITLSPGEIDAGVAIESPDGGQPPRHASSQCPPEWRDWATSIRLHPGDAWSQTFEEATCSLPREGYMLDAGEWMIDYHPFPKPDAYHLRWTPVSFWVNNRARD